jgi:tripartite-type tricarboxylate transporter receptor subunit TctC
MEGTVRHRRALTRRQVLKASAGALPLVIAAGPASAQAAYPARPVKVVIPYPPAGGADTVGRLLFQKLGEMWGAQFVIDNRGGAGGTIAAAAVAKAERDGYTIMYDATAHSVNPSLYANLPYDTVKDFQAVFLAALVTNLLLVNKSVDVQSVADVIALAKATPGGLDWASSGNGTVQHLALEMFKHRAGIKLNHIPYRGGGPVLNDLIGGQVKFYFSMPPPRSGMSRRERSSASPIPAADVWRPCPMCRRWRKRCRASKPMNGTGCSYPPERPRTSFKSSMPA